MKTTAGPEPIACAVCDTNPLGGRWTDQHGQIYCSVCGTPYQVWHYVGEGDDQVREQRYELSVKAESVPLLRRYYAEHGTTNGQGCFIGISTTERDYPGQLEGSRQFCEWINALPEDDDDVVVLVAAQESMNLVDETTFS